MLNTEQLDELRRTPPGGANRIAVAMRLATLTQVELAERTGFTQSYVSRVKDGRYSDLPTETTRAFAAAFGCSIEDLFPAREAVA